MTFALVLPSGSVVKPEGHDFCLDFADDDEVDVASARSPASITHTNSPVKPCGGDYKLGFCLLPSDNTLGPFSALPASPQPASYPGIALMQ